MAHVRWTANRNMEVFLRMIASGQVQLNPLISHEFPLEEAARAYGTVLDPASSSLAVVMRYPEAEQTNTTGDDVSNPQRNVEISPSRDNRHSRPASVAELNAALSGAGNLARWRHRPALKGTARTT